LAILADIGQFKRCCANIGAIFAMLANIGDIAPMLVQYLQRWPLLAILRQYWFTDIAPISNNIYCTNIGYSWFTLSDEGR